MERNITTGHGGLRIVAACGLLILALDLFAVIGDTKLAWLVPTTAILGLIMAATGLSGYCPIYAGLGIGKSRSPT